MNSPDLYTDVPLHISVATIVKHAHRLLQVAADRDREEAKRMDAEFEAINTPVFMACPPELTVIKWELARLQSRLDRALAL